MVRSGVCAGAILVEMMIASVVSLLLMSVVVNLYIESRQSVLNQNRVFDLIDRAIDMDAILHQTLRKDHRLIRHFYWSQAHQAVYLRNEAGQSLRVIDGVTGMQVRSIKQDGQLMGVEVATELVSGSLHKMWYHYVPVGRNT